MRILFGSTFVSIGDLLWLLFLYVGVPVLLVIGVVVLVIFGLKSNPPETRDAESSDKK